MPSHIVDSPDSDSPKKSQAQPLNRACEACRVSKVRCLVNPVAGSTQCQRCAKAGKACVFAPPTKRRQRKRTDVRVTELEKEIQKMRNLLQSSNQPSNEMSEHESADEQSDEQAQQVEKETPPDPQSHGSTTSTTSAFANPWPIVPPIRAHVPGPTNTCGPRDPLGPSADDIIDRGVITKEQAEELLSIWRSELVNGCPGVIVPKDWTALELREKKPALFHSIMAAASHSKGSALSDKLHEEAVYLYARSVFINGEKSVQTIQALLVTIAFYSPPRTPGQLQIYQWVNMAASMALELGLASKPRTHEQLPKRAIRSLQRISSPEELLENCRTVLLIYIISAGFSMRLKRPNILLFNNWMEECYNLLDKSKILDDKRIIAWLKLQRIADEANTAFGFDDASTSFSLSELRMQIILRIFDRRMQDWKRSVPDDVMTVFTTIEYHQNMMSMWEFGMDGGQYDVTEFRNRHLTLPALDDDCVQPESLLSRSALQINATTKVISASHSILDCFISIPPDMLQRSPNVIYVRSIYALVALMKAEYAIGTDPDMRELLDGQSLKVAYYLDTVIQKTREASGPQRCRIPTHWSFVLDVKLKSWWDEYLEWRKEDRQQKRRKMNDADKSAAATGNQTPPFADSKAQPPRSSNPMQPSTNQGMPSTSQFALGNPYPSWNTNDIQLDATTASSQRLGGQTPFTPDIGDFSSAFQNGDLYLWNDMTADSFSGWGLQSDLYSGMGFGPLNGQGF